MGRVGHGRVAFGCIRQACCELVCGGLHCVGLRSIALGWVALDWGFGFGYVGLLWVGWLCVKLPWSFVWLVSATIDPSLWTSSCLVFATWQQVRAHVGHGAVHHVPYWSLLLDQSL